MITIDGSEGEGGGQVLRYAAALSLLTGEPFTIENIRGGRAKPGLMRQHVTALEAACTIGDAKCSGLAVGSSSLSFQPGRVKPGNYNFAIGTAGSTSLVLQTVLMPLLLANGPSHLVIEGGTHAMAAPPFEFMQKALLPILSRMGPKVSIQLERHGFFPRGGGRIVVEIEPSALRSIECLERGAFMQGRVEAVLAGIPRDIAERELTAARKVLSEWPDDAFTIRQLPGEHGPGNALLVEAEFENITEVVSSFGKLGVPAEKLAKSAARSMAGYLALEAFAGPYLQDQLLLPFALAKGGAFTTVRQSEHTRTAAKLIERFTGIKFRFSDQGKRTKLVEIVG
ncbi:RNA 3'-terminal phosphate cyclase [Hwanghaeella grinnelliae]|uniref:RNA 3'-terminal phosphate cyclase n=1 Tax=Hwanghaeella grinnelliae TaxID=2500179 RepID=A0A437QL31_9PROT|nr:RNA 3'-terminal phosphate cyclase [Hwanghaeella grinnelliae]RVU35223.1 RNA 3'-terminal phosphate cyclase [Hwanghaeella grinnelliae]